jgi:2-oxoglutarate ferredoxin oxidoreductase subunit gamma
MEEIFKEIKMRKEVKIGGFGGQGIILAGVILGKAACVFSGLNAVQTQSYGPEARGGASKAEVVISDGVIGYPGVEQADILVAMSQQAWDKYNQAVKESSKIIIDPDLVTLGPSEKRVYKVKATKIATNLGSKIVANMVMLGALIGITGLVPKDAMEKAILDSVPKRTLEVNKRAYEEGFKEGRIREGK